MRITRIKKILLAKMTELRANFLGYREMIVYDQTNAGPASEGGNDFCEPANFLLRGAFGAQLNEVCPTLTKLLGHYSRRASVQIGGIDERVKAALGERLHGIAIASWRVERLQRVRANIRRHNQSEHKAAAPRLPRKMGAKIIHCNHCDQARRRLKAASQD